MQIQFDKWGELDHDTEHTEEISTRLAICNMDWDRVGAEDLFLAMASFCPGKGSVRRVRIFLSEFGKKRLAEEEKLGPEELRMNENDQDSDSDDEQLLPQPGEDERREKKTMEKIRQYQINRLKYYYAVAEFDSEETANAVYGECDGSEYELSATRFDLRFVPDDMEFDVKDQKEVCDSAPDPEHYQPKLFMTTALQQGKVDLTWDETDPARLAAMKKAFEVDDEECEKNEELKKLIAFSDEEEDQVDNKLACGSDNSEDEEETKDAISKYKALLQEISTGKNHQDQGNVNAEDNEDGNMEMVFKDTTVSKEEVDSDPSEMTPWEQYLHKKREKRKRRLEKKTIDEKDDDIDEQVEMEKAFSDDDLPDGMDIDEFFKDEEETSKSSKKGKSNEKLSKKEIRKKRKLQDLEREKTAKSDLNLLVMDSDEDRDHFDYKEIVKRESKSKKRRLKKGSKPDEEKKVEDFELDIKDKRFHAVFENSNFNIDPSHPNFKKTKSMQKLISEKQKRFEKNNPEYKSQSRPEKRDKSDVMNLVKSVQLKSKAHSSKKKKLGSFKNKRSK